MLGRKFSNELNINIKGLDEIIRSNDINEEVKKKLIYKNILFKINILVNNNEQQTADSKHFFKFKEP